MNIEIYKRVLGVANPADPLQLLGLRASRSDPGNVQAALRLQLSKVFAADLSSEDADLMRRRLRAAARQIIAARQRADEDRPLLQTNGHRRVPAIKPRSAGAVRRRTDMLASLTDFDRDVLAVLVGCGGWNKTARSRLVALSGRYGVSVQGLLRVMTGLSEYAREGGATLEVAQIASSRGVGMPPAAMTRQTRSAPQGRLAQLHNEFIDRVSAEFQPSDPWSTTRLAMVFGLLTLLVGLLAVRFLFFAGDFEPRTPEGGAIAEAPADTPSPWLTPSVSRGAESDVVDRLAVRGRMPSFQGQPLSAAASKATDECPRLPEELRRLARKVTISDTPSDEVFRSWKSSVETIGTSWVLVDRRTRDRIDDAILELLYASAGTPSVTDRLLAELAAPTDHFADPSVIWRGSWKVGTLGLIAGSNNLPPVLVERARALLENAVGEERADQAVDFDTAASAWLERAITPLVALTTFETRVYDYWESWIAAERRIGRGERFEQALMGAMTQLLETSIDLSNEGPGQNVLGRLLTITDLRASPTVKDGVREHFDRIESITPHDLWVLTSLLARGAIAPWFDTSLVVPDDADWVLRRRIADRVQAAWPPDADARRESLALVKGIPVDAEVGARWRAMVQVELAEPLGRTPEDLLVQLLRASRFNEAVSDLAAGGTAVAADLLDALDSDLFEETDASGDSNPPGARDMRPNGRSPISPGGSKRSKRRNRIPVPGPPSPPGSGSGTLPGGRLIGQPIGRDGEWALAYEESARSTEDRVRWLETLESSAGTDLGPLDAAVFVRVVYRGSPQLVRQLAQEILVTRFGDGPIVALEMLDKLPSTVNDPTAEAIQLYTGALLPEIGSETWAADVRLVLVEHALEVRVLAGTVVEDLLLELTESYFNRLMTLKGSVGGLVAPESPGDAAARLHRTWGDLAESVRYAASPDEELATLEHRRVTREQLAAGPLQSFVARQLAILELMSFVTIAEQPTQQAALVRLLSRESGDRANLAHVLEQAVVVERAMTQVWSKRITFEEDGS